MLRNLFGSVPRTSSRFLFVNSNRSVPKPRTPLRINKPQFTFQQFRPNFRTQSSRKVPVSQANLTLVAVITAGVTAGAFLHYYLGVFINDLVSTVMEEVEQEVELLKKRRCVYGKLKKDAKADDDQELFKNERVELVLWNPLCEISSSGLEVILASGVYLHLPNVTTTSDANEIRDALKTRGINAEPSEEGIRLGMQEYALSHLRKGVRVHVEQKCDCLPYPVCLPYRLNDEQLSDNVRITALIDQMLTDTIHDTLHDSSRSCIYGKQKQLYNESTSKIPGLLGRDALEGERVELLLWNPGFTTTPKGTIVAVTAAVVVKLPNVTVRSDYNELCIALQRRGIDAENSDEGARSGIVRYAMQNMQSGVEMHGEKKCNCVQSDKDAVNTALEIDEFFNQ